MDREKTRKFFDWIIITVFLLFILATMTTLTLWERFR